MPKHRTSKRRSVRWYSSRIDRLVFLVFAAAFILLTPGRLLPVTPVPLELPVLTRPSPLPLPKPAPYPVNRSGIVPGSEITAEAIIIRDLTSGVYMYKMNSDIQLSPASTTKILTALVTLDIMNPDDVVTVNTVMNDGMAMGLFTGERMTVENLLYGMLIHSGNDAAYALAENYPGGVAAFVDAMNAKARTLHLTGSSFTNPVGYDDPGHKMTALDLSQLASVALSNRTISKMVAIPSITVSDVTHTYFHQLKNVNQLLGKIPGVAGIKTGWTQEAGENLVTLVERNNRKVIMVVLHSQDRFGDTTELIDWVFSSFEWVDFAPE